MRAPAWLAVAAGLLLGMVMPRPACAQQADGARVPSPPAAAARDAPAPGPIALATARFRLLPVPGSPGLEPEAVSLPHRWSRHARGESGLVTGLYEFDLPRAAGAEPLWVYVPKLRTNAAFELNGQWIGDGGRMTAPVARHANSPFFLALPPSLLKPSDNRLVIRVVSPEGTLGGLSQVQIGTHAQLDDIVAARRLVQNAGVYITSAIIASTSLYILMVWLQIGGQRGKGFLPLGIAGLTWSARNLNLLLLDFGTTSETLHRAFEYATFTGHGLFLGLFGIFLLGRYDTVISPRLARLFRLSIYGFLAMGPILLLAFGGPAPALTVWMMASSPLLLAMIWILVRRARATRTVADALLALLFTAFIAASAYDNAVLMVNALFGRVYIAHYVGLLFFVTVAWLLGQQHVQALRAHEALNQSLEERLAQREAQLRVSFEATRALEADRSALAERARIMRDLHDGVGAQLLTAIAEVEDGRADPDRIRDTLTACLDDLRLAVDSLEPHDNYLTTILGTLRYRLAPRLARAGLTMQWDVEEVNPMSWLDPTRTLHLLRILQEAIANVLRHAQATTLLIRLARRPDGVLVEVRDNGVGFDPDASPGRGHGLRNLRQRAAQLGARLTLTSSPAGTSVTLLLPN